ncbi:MAG: beta-ketoacyl synthase [Desulfobulbaceae bacterium]|nr:beta-ketoacyl synthase [Desulfobulbaceae bacterium]
MNKKVVVVGRRIQTALGDGEQTWSGLTGGCSGLSPFFLPGFTDEYPLGMVELLTGPIGSYARLLELIRHLVVGYELLSEIAAEAELLVATTKGAADEILSGNINSLQGQAWQIGKLAAEQYGIKGEVQTISAACASGTLALIRGAQRIRAGNTKIAVILGIDLVSRFVAAGFASLKGLAPKHCRPFDQQRDGLALGEGAGLIILADEEYAHSQGLPCEARLSGWATGCDGVHITAPCREGSGLTSVLRQIIEHSDLPVGGINAHGTGTMYNDAMELTAFANIWGDEIPPVHSVKGAIGHCLGAAGVIEAAIAISSLQQGVIPPTTGLRQTENSFLPISPSTSLPLSHPSILSCNSGFGGINAAVLFSQ